MEIEFIKPFISGVVEVMKVQFNCECKPLAPVPKPKMATPPVFDIAGIIGLRGNRFNGSVALELPDKVFLKLMSNMLGEEFTAISPENEDGAGEMLNMIFGHAKTILNEKGYSIEKAIPTVVTGKSLSLKSLPSKNTLVMPFECQYGSFYLEIGSDEGT